MVHDVLPSDVWWHDTDSIISRIYDVVWFERFTEKGLKYVISLSTDIKSKYREALLIDEHRAQSGVINREELKKTNEWEIEGISSIGGIISNFRYLVTMTHLGADVNEIEILAMKIKIMLSELREHTRDRYIFEREVERRG